MKPNEITEEIVKRRIKTALENVKLNVPSLNVEATVDLVYDAGLFRDFVGIVHKATEHERQRAVSVVRRLGHAQTARVIAQG